MYCTNCGMKFSGKFCPVCGQGAHAVTEEYIAAQARLNSKTQNSHSETANRVVTPPIISKPTVPPKPAPIASAPPKKERGSFGRFVFFVLAVSVFLLIFNLGGKWDTVPSSSSTPAPTERVSSTPPNPVVFPTNGHYDIKPQNTTGYSLYGEDYAQSTAPFRVAVPSTHKYYCVQLYDHLNGKRVVTVYVHGGKTVEIEVPLGTYKLYYSGGDVWYGPFRRFLESGVYRKSEDLLEFYQDGDYACGVDLELQVSIGGNMDSQDISYSNFPDY